ncbi:MAG: hypothetical protein OEY14_01425 [Myxococcales bacterium]|nr:hypothetical protein [Myxococcales bacterium]
MLEVFGAAACASLLAPLLQARAWGVPFGLLSVAMVLRAAFGALLGALLLGVLALVLLGLWGDVQHAPRSAALFAGLMAISLGALGARRHRLRRGAILLVYRMREADAREQARAALDRLLLRLGRGAEPRSVMRHAALVLAIVQPLTSFDLWEDARRYLEAIRRDALDPRTRGMVTQALATTLLHLGQCESARLALAELERPLDDPGVETWIRATEALLLAVTGEPERALARVGEDAIEEDASLRASHRIIRAHALAGLGERSRAERELRAVVLEAGPAALERALRPAGPASELARALDARE